MTNILKISPINGAQTSFSLTTNSQWVDEISFPQTGFPAAFSVANCGLTLSSSTVTVPTSALLVPGMTIIPTSGIPFPTVTGIPNLCYVGGVTSLTSFTLSDALGNALTATATNPGAILGFTAPPLDLTGINFISSIVQTNTSNPRILLTAQTQNGTLINGGTSGTLQYNVPQSMVAQLLPGIYSLDIIAYDGTYTINLFPQGPASVTVSAGVSTTVIAAGINVITTPPAQP